MQLDMESPSWIVILTMFSPLFLMPLSRRLVETPTQARRHERASLAAAILLGLSFCWQPALSTALLAVPWLWVRVLFALRAWRSFRVRGVYSGAEVCLLSSTIFPCIGAAWLLANRANWTPLGFDPVIILLTGAHFHHAGFTLPLLAGKHGKKDVGHVTRLTCLLILAGVPVVAAGITCTHFGWLPWVEPMGVVFLVAGSVCVALLQMRLAGQSHLAAAHRLLLAFSGLALLVAMTLALGFGLRHVLPWAALSMPQMWVIHGSLNVFGFGFCGLLGWRLMEHGQSSR